MSTASAVATGLARSAEERELLWKGRKNAFGAIGRVSPFFLVQDGVLGLMSDPEGVGVYGELGGGYRSVLTAVRRVQLPPTHVYREDLLGGVTDLLGSLPDLGGLNLDLVNPLPPMQGLVDGVTSIAGQMTSALGPLNDLLGSG